MWSLRFREWLRGGCNAGDPSPHPMTLKCPPGFLPTIFQDPFVTQHLQRACGQGQMCGKHSPHQK